jgi:TRAP-type C4-dicarboxylate transport system permease small subunit
MYALAISLRGLITAAGALAVGAYAIAAVLTVANIIGRTVGLPVPGIVDLVQLCVVAGAWLAIPYTFRVGGHVSVDVLLKLLPLSVGKLLTAVARLVALLLLALILWQCYGAFQQQMMFGDRSQQLGIPMTYYWLPLLIGVAIALLAEALNLLADLTRRVRP